jgi:hypothetical protein
MPATPPSRTIPQVPTDPPSVFDLAATRVIPSDPNVTTPRTAPPPIPTIPTPTRCLQDRHRPHPNLSTTVELALAFDTTVRMRELQNCGSNLAAIHANVT